SCEAAERRETDMADVTEREPLEPRQLGQWREVDTGHQLKLEHLEVLERGERSQPLGGARADPADQQRADGATARPHTVERARDGVRVARPNELPLWRLRACRSGTRENDRHCQSQ